MEKAKRNVIVIMLDSLQFNYLGCHGNTWIKTPNIDRLAREGVLFENQYIEGLPTVPCRRAMHTGRYTLPVNGWSPLTMDDTTIADLCWGRPIDTALIFDCPMYRLPKFGYTRSFDKVWFLHGHEGDHYYYAQDPLIHLKTEDFHEDHIIQRTDEVLGEKIIGPLLHETSCFLKQRQYWRGEEDQHVAKVMKMAAKYLENADRTKSFFLWVDSFDPHEPWDSPSVYDPDLKCPYDPDYTGKDMFLPVMGDVAGVFTEEEMHHIRMLYAEKVTVVDRWVGYLLERIKALGLEENTLIMLVSDHGEPMGNGEHGHGIMRKCRPWPYEELAHGVCILKGPDLPAGRRISAYTQSVDVAPTVTDWLGIGQHPDMQGVSLLPLARGEVEKVRNAAVAGYYRYSWSIITDEWSFIHWLHAEEQSLGETFHSMYGEETSKTSAYLQMQPSAASEAAQMHKEAATLDGEDQWTCTPGSLSTVPERDGLYDRKADPFQLKNVAAEHPDVARQLLTELQTILTDLRVS